MGDTEEAETRAAQYGALEAREYIGGPGLPGLGYQRRLPAKGEQSCSALQQVLRAIDCGVSLTELKRAIATVETHI